MPSERTPVLPESQGQRRSSRQSGASLPKASSKASLGRQVGRRSQEGGKSPTASQHQRAHDLSHASTNARPPREKLPLYPSKSLSAKAGAKLPAKPPLLPKPQARPPATSRPVPGYMKSTGPTAPGSARGKTTAQNGSNPSLTTAGRSIVTAARKTTSSDRPLGELICSTC